MKRVLLDTDIYGLMAVDADRAMLKDTIKSSGFVIYGNSVVRKELRQAPKGFVDGINLRLDLLRLYEAPVKKELPTAEREQRLADAYSRACLESGGSTSPRKPKDGFLIVASASTHNLDIVVSEDSSTMLNELAAKAYRIVNAAMKLNAPEFIGYEEFKRHPAR